MIRGGILGPGSRSTTCFRAADGTLIDWVGFCQRGRTRVVSLVSGQGYTRGYSANWQRGGFGNHSRIRFRGRCVGRVGIRRCATLRAGISSWWVSRVHHGSSGQSCGWGLHGRAGFIKGRGRDPFRCRFAPPPPLPWTEGQSDPLVWQVLGELHGC